MAKINAINNKTGSLTIDPGASGDSYTQYSINGTGEFRVGVDDDASDAYKISQGSALGTNDTFVMTASGERTMPLQPAFLAVVESTISNVTGDNTVYTVVWDAEPFDQNSDFDGTSTFTAPVTGKYRFECSILMDDLTASHDRSELKIVTSNRTYSSQNSPGTCRDANDQYSEYTTVLADMDASDTAYVTITVFDGTKVVDILGGGSSDPGSWFSGNLEV
jgi:hypothetical protein